VLVVALVLLEHVRGVESERSPGRAGTSAADNNRGPSPLVADGRPSDGNIIGGGNAAGSEIADRETTGRDAAKHTTTDDIAGSTNEPRDGAEAAIRKTADAFVAAFDRGDAAAIAALWTADGEYLDGAGNRFVGRGAIERQYAQFFAEHPQTRIEVRIDAIRPISADAAIEDGHATLRMPGASPSSPSSSPYTVIHAKTDDRWLMASVREPQAEQPESRDPLTSLDWLVGSWQAEQNGGRMDVTYRWVANRNFLERTYSVEQGGRITASGVQLIGRDAGNEELQSWNFTSDAGFAVGSWIPQSDGWAIATRGKLPDGTTTAAVNYLTRLDENTLGWQSRERKAGGKSLTDTEAVRLTRVGGGR
ncbi:MAG TPA: SgcJ/EcaC family oxidoreductase, partial [Pirellulales bacterium]